MSRVQQSWEQGQRDAVEHEPRLARKYEESLRAHGVEARRRYLASAGMVAAAEKPKPGASPQELVPEQSFKESITAKTRSARTAIVKSVGNAMLKHTPEKVKAIPGIDAFMATLAAAQAQYAYEAVQDMLASIILESYENGWSVDETADQILEVSQDWARWQAERLARTDLVSLANESSLRSVKTMHEDDQPRYKIWLTAQDERVRPTHVEGNRQAQLLDDPFVIGGSTLRYPGDPQAPPGEIMNCRCTIVYSDVPDPELSYSPDPSEEELAMAAAAVDHTGGSMIALYPVDPEPLFVEGGQNNSDLHVTLAFLPDGVDGERADLVDSLAALAAGYSVLTGSVSGVGYFASGEDGVPVIALPSVVGLVELRTSVIDALVLSGTTYANNWGYNPHITLKYLKDGEAVEPADVIGVPLEFRGIYLVEGNERTFFPFAD